MVLLKVRESAKEGISCYEKDLTCDALIEGLL